MAVAIATPITSGKSVDCSGAIPPPGSKLPATPPAPPPTKAGSNGYLIHVNNDDAEKINLRVLSHTTALGEKSLSFFVPREQQLELLFFRKIFDRLKHQVPEPLRKICEMHNEDIPLEVFQRAFERLFYVLRDAQGFDASVYDDNGNGFVGWGEFCYVFKQRKMSIKLSWSERIYLMFDNQDSCIAAHIISTLILATIMLSSLCFILSTVPKYQTHPADGSAPQPSHLFRKIELGCLGLFVVEYVSRLLTCWSVRAEIFDEKTLLELTAGYDEIRLPSPLGRLFRFMTTPSNMVDLAAIAPGIMGLFLENSRGGGGFVVLRLIRLTRIFRALRTIRGPAIVLARTIQSSMKAFFVLAFNLLLLIVISGSLMYLAEGGAWDPYTRTFLRDGPRFWNETSKAYEQSQLESPFLSIPHSFWWAVVTATTVGYGEVYPTTSIGYVIAVMNMVVSAVILALPVGVIGGSFNQNWRRYDQDIRNSLQGRAEDIEVITRSLQEIDPMTLSRLLLIDVWNDRFPSEPAQAWGETQTMAQTLPLPAEFMGQVVLELNLPSYTPVRKQVRVPLQEDLDIVKRSVTGFVTLRYEWLPKETSPPKDSYPDEDDFTGVGAITPLEGKLSVTLVSAEKLLNLDLQSACSASNPFCTVISYPKSPCPTTNTVKPLVWRAPTELNSLAPSWNASYVFEFSWQKRTRSPRKTVQGVFRPECSPKLSRVVSGNIQEPPQVPAMEDRFEQALRMLHSLGTELKQVRSKVSVLQEQVDDIYSQKDVDKKGAMAPVSLS
eukprot:TRINITY_DN5495_c0_g2_i1.p1 TRINITY_DN5495_c0_g2~~TRINITY_DN5495_c0_g2_i1.p1  ORF type:complete len:778 (+),score=181.01 TRINITY_DN5495_c0_g2_i1:124-2457(+)